MRASRFFGMSRIASASLVAPSYRTFSVFGSNLTISVLASILSWIAWLLNATFS